MSDARATSAMDHVLGKKLRTAREQAGLSQQGLAAKLGITFQQIQKYEKGANRIAASRLVSIAQALGQPVSFFLDDGKEAAAPRARAADALTTPEQVSLATFFAAIQNAKVRRRVSDLLRAIIEADAARKATAPASKRKLAVRKPANRAPGRTPRR
jgi:transcriptional regulator with XRE-family HTH domain